jgi:vitamin B12 transporter
MRYFYLVFGLFFLFSNNVFAVDLEKIKVTSSRETLTAENIPASLSVFTEAEIKKKNFPTVEDLLRGELGLDVVQSGPTGSQTSIFMRGAGSTSTLVIIDGVEVNAGTTGSFDTGDLTVDNIERIEVLRGPQSIQWGANAVGGVINIITKKGKGEPTHTISVEGGGWTQRASYRSSGSIDKMDYSASASVLNSNAFSALNERSGGSERDGTNNKTLSTRLGYDFNSDTRLEFMGRYTKSNDETDSINGEGPPSENWSNNKDMLGTFNNVDDLILSAPFQKYFGSRWNLKLTPSFFYNRALTVNDVENDGVINRTYTLDMQNNIELHPNVSVLFGGEYQNKRGQNIGGSNNAEGYKKWNDNEALFLQGIYELPGRVVLTAGFRQDWNTTWGETTTEKVEGSYQLPNTTTTLHAAYATGFRAPSFNELYAPPPSGWTKTSNESLVPEEIKGSELGVKQNLMNGRAKLGTTFFYTETKNFIHGDPSFVLANFGEYISYGQETSIDLKLSNHYSFSIHHTWNHHYLFEKTRPNHLHMGTRRPKHKLNANLYYNSPNVESLVGLFIRSRAKGFDAKNETAAFGTVRAAITYTLPVIRNVKFSLRAENLLDARALEVGGFGSPGRSIHTGLSYTFN